jgi:lipoprotein-releasing system permease protein
MRPELWLSAKYLRRHKRTPAFFISLVAMLGVAIGVAVLIVVLSVMNGFDRHLKEKLLGFNYHVNAYTSGADQMLAERIDDMDGVSNAVLIAQIQTAVRHEKLIAPAVLTGISYNEQEREYWQDYLVEGDLNGLVLGRILMERLGLKIGDTIGIFDPDTLKPVEYPIAGYFEVGLYDLDNTVLALPLEGNLKFFEKVPDSWAVGVRLYDPSTAPQFKRNLYSADMDGVEFVRTWYEQNRTLFGALELERLVMFIILSFIILVASFNIFATQTVRVVEKIKDVGILKTIGLNSNGIGLMFCLQGMLIGTLGIALGLGIGIGLCYLIQYTDVVKLPAEIYYIDRLPVLVRFSDVAYICAVALGMSFLFSIIPALKAASIKEVDALKYE